MSNFWDEVEIDCNGSVIDWDHWKTVDILDSAQAIKLMCAIDPYKDLHESDARSKMQDKFKMIKRLADNLGVFALYPREWLAWAKEKRLKIHYGFSNSFE